MKSQITTYQMREMKHMQSILAMKNQLKEREDYWHGLVDNMVMSSLRELISQKNDFIEAFEEVQGPKAKLQRKLNTVLENYVISQKKIY